MVMPRVDVLECSAPPHPPSATNNATQRHPQRYMRHASTATYPPCIQHPPPPHREPCSCTCVFRQTQCQKQQIGALTQEDTRPPSERKTTPLSVKQTWRARMPTFRLTYALSYAKRTANNSRGNCQTTTRDWRASKQKAWSLLVQHIYAIGTTTVGRLTYCRQPQRTLRLEEQTRVDSCLYTRL